MDYKKKSTKQVSSYFLIEEIGKGASAKVYLSVDERKDELVAIKTIPVENLKKDNGLINLKRELQILHKLKHDNIVKIKDFQSTKRNNYVVMEYCNGGNLFEYKRFYEKVTKSTLNEFFIQKIIRQITDGLQYMHSQNIVHRDIKLENILLNFNKYPNYAIKGNMPPKVRYEDVTLNDSFTIKIADLGYSKELNESMGSTILGTPMHMSPDIIGNYVGTETKKYNTSVDLWSLGTITYQLLTGKYPFIGKGHEEIFKHVMEGKYSLPSSLTVSVELITFINGLLQFYPEKRLNWEQIKSHPFLTKNIENFNYIELKGLEENDKKVIEMNAKDCDNLLWVLFKSKGLNMNLDKLNMNEIKNKQMKQNIKENVVNNEEIKKAIEAEKKKIEEEKKRLLKEKKEAEKLKKEAEELKKEVNLIQQKNEKEKEKINEEEKKRKELEEKLKKEGELNKQKEEEIKKQIDDYKKKIKEVEKTKKQNDQKLKEAEKLLKNAEKMKKEAENQMNNLNKQKQLEEKSRKEEEEKLKSKEKELLQEKNKFEKEIEKIKNEQKKKEENYKEEKNKLSKQIEEMNKLKSDLEKEVDKNKEVENELQKKEYAIKEFKDKLKKLTDEKDKEIERYENEKKELEMLQDKVKYKVENLKLNLLEQNDGNNKEGENNDNDLGLENCNLKIEDSKINEENKKEEEKNDIDDWIILGEGEDTVSVNLNDNKYQQDVLDEYEIIDIYDEKDEKVETSKKVEV